jgi:hypothetical protein
MDRQNAKKFLLNRRRFLSLGGGVAASALLPSPSALALPPSGIASPVLTRGNDNDRSYFYNDTILNVDSVRTQGIRRYFSLYMEGDARGAEAQALIQPSVLCDDGNVRDVIITASMNNTVWAYDYNTSDILWVKKLGIPINGSGAIDMHNINDHWGLLSTGVIDPDTKTWYGVAWESPDGTAQNGAHFVHALNIANGSRAHAPVPLAGLTYQPPLGGALQSWSATMRKQRCSLTLTKVNGVKTILFAAGTVQEIALGSAGWIVAYDVATNKIAAGLAMSAGSPSRRLWRVRLQSALHTCQWQHARLARCRRLVVALLRCWPPGRGPHSIESDGHAHRKTFRRQRADLRRPHAHQHGLRTRLERQGHRRTSLQHQAHRQRCSLWR